MFVLVKYQDGVKKIVPSSHIKHFDPEHISYSKKYKIKWENGEYYDGVIIIVGDTETKVQQKALQKRQKITPFELCESADDTDDSSVTGKIHNKNNNEPKDYIKQIVTRKIEKVQMNLDKFVKGRGTGETSEKKTNDEPLSSDITLMLKGNQTKSKESTKLMKAKNSSSAFVLKKDVSSIENVDSKTTAKVNRNIEDNRKVNGKGTQELNQKDQRSKFDIPSVNKPSISGKNIRVSSKQTAPPSMEKKIDLKTQPIIVTTKNNGCDSSKKAEKKLQDEVSNLDRINTQLKQALKDKDKMLVESTRLNMDLQSKVLDQFDELKLIVGDMKQRAQENLEKNQGVLPVGYRRLDKSMIHLGQDVWITIPQYDSISCLSDTSAKFVKNLAIAIFGTTTLKNSSVTGVVSNRVKNKNTNAIARPKLDPTKLLAVKGALAFWLRTEKNVDEVSIDIEVTRVGTHISHKIFELLRKDKKMDDYLHADRLPEVVIADNDDDMRGQESEDSDGEKSNVSCGTEKSNNDVKESDEEIGAQETNNEIGGIVREDDEEPENSRDEDSGAENSQNDNGDEDKTYSENSEE